MKEGGDFVEYLELQGTLELVTKSELLEQVRERGGHLSSRQLTSYVSEGLIPKSARIGSRAGAYPKIVVDLVLWIDECRRRGLSVDAIRELIPLWRFLRQAFSKRFVDFGEFEYLARQFVLSVEACYAVPSLFFECMPCPIHEVEDLAATRFVMKGGKELDTSQAMFVPLSFRIAHQDEEGEVTVLATTRLALPLTYEGDDSDIILGVPNGVEVPIGHDPSPSESEDAEAT